MKKFKVILILIVSFFLLNVSCSTFKIVNVNKEADFSLSKYSTYNLYKLDIDTTAYEELSERLMLLRSELMVQLQDYGLTRVQNDPELLINVGIYLEDKEQTHEGSGTIYMSNRDYEYEQEEVVISEYKEGTITFDFIKASDKTLECMAIGEGIVVKNDKGAEQNIRKSLKKLFKEIDK